MTHDGFALGACAVVLADFFQFSHDLAAGIAASQIKFDASHHIAARGAGFAQLHQSRDSALGSCAPCLDALANPYLFLCQHFVGAGIDHSLLGQLLFLEQLVLTEVARIAEKAATVKVDNSCGNRIQKSPVVADHDGTAFVFSQQRLQPADGVQIQVVGRLVQQQYVGLGYQGLRQCYALLQTARQAANGGSGVKVQPLQGFFDALFPIPCVERFDFCLQGVQVK